MTANKNHETSVTIIEWWSFSKLQQLPSSYCHVNLNYPYTDYSPLINISEYRKTYTFAFPRNRTAFTCINSRTCPTINAPPPCPRGYMSTREDEACGVYCRDIVGYRYRCRCTNWRECAAKQTYMLGCISNHYASYRVRECVQGKLMDNSVIFNNVYNNLV